MPSPRDRRDQLVPADEWERRKNEEAADRIARFVVGTLSPSGHAERPSNSTEQREPQPLSRSEINEW